MDVAARGKRGATAAVEQRAGHFEFIALVRYATEHPRDAAASPHARPVLAASGATARGGGHERDADEPCCPKGWSCPKACRSGDRRAHSPSKQRCVFETPPPIALPTEVPRANAFIVDPFDSANAGVRGADLLLVGTFVAPRRSMALLQSGNDVDGFAPGQKIGAERLGRVVPREVELARDDGFSRKLTLVEDRK